MWMNVCFHPPLLCERQESVDRDEQSLKELQSKLRRWKTTRRTWWKYDISISFILHTDLMFSALSVTCFIYSLSLFVLWSTHQPFCLLASVCRFVSFTLGGGLMVAPCKGGMRIRCSSREQNGQSLNLQQKLWERTNRWKLYVNAISQIDLQYSPELDRRNAWRKKRFLQNHFRLTVLISQI